MFRYTVYGIILRHDCCGWVGLSLQSLWKSITSLQRVVLAGVSTVYSAFLFTTKHTFCRITRNVLCSHFGFNYPFSLFLTQTIVFVCWVPTFISMTYKASITELYVQPLRNIYVCFYRYGRFTAHVIILFSYFTKLKIPIWCCAVTHYL